MANPNYFHPLIKVPDQPGEYQKLSVEEIDLPEQYWQEGFTEDTLVDTYTVFVEDSTFIGAVGIDGKYFLTIIGDQMEPENWSYLRH